MISFLTKKIFGSRNQRLLKHYGRSVKAIGALEAQMQALNDEQLREKTNEFKRRLAAGETLDDLLVEAFAVLREASVRTLGMRPFDVQLLGGIVLHHGKIAEMHTGEGKTLVASLPVYLNALKSKGVHVVTVNPYLANRDAETLRPLFEFLGLSLGVIAPEMAADARRDAYAKDVTYGTNNEFGFDYLRDNMAFTLEERVQRDLHYVVIDEVDSILIDEARTPLIISGAVDGDTNLYQQIDKLVHLLVPRKDEDDTDGHYSVNEKDKAVYLTEAGHQALETLFAEAGLLADGTTSLYDGQNMLLMHHIMAALRANLIFQKNIDYVVKDNDIVIIDEHTGRALPGRRWSEGLHQAIEAKEGVEIQKENQTLASITFQNFFRLYHKLSGMTGTADTEAYEFQQIYGLEVVVVPTNRPMIREDMVDAIYLTQQGKFEAIVKDIAARHERGQPLLVGTASIESSEALSALLKQVGIEHQVLNAKFHQKEAEIIAQAGRKGAVTIATNMAGRGTDIVLGGHPVFAPEAAKHEVDKDAAQVAWRAAHDEVLALGGLHVLGTERNESRRIDNQLRGRSGRQGDPGSSQFFLSLEDGLMRIFASDRVKILMQRLGMKADEAIEHPMVTRAIESAQRKVEGHHFDVRKQLLSFDDVANDQRSIIYQKRFELMSSETVTDAVNDMRQKTAELLAQEYMPSEAFEEQWRLSDLEKVLEQDFKLKLDLHASIKSDEAFDQASLVRKITAALTQRHEEKRRMIGDDALHQLEKTIVLQTLDTHWRAHLAAMDQLRQSIHLRGYAQKDPAREYKRECFNLFMSMLEVIRREVTAILASIEIQLEQVDEMEAHRRQAAPSIMSYEHADFHEAEDSAEENSLATQFADPQLARSASKPGRNEMCPCGSGRKYKHCCGSISS